MIHTYEKLEEVPTPPPDGTFAVVDVLRFSTTACTIFEQGADLIHPVRSEEDAFDIKSEREGVLLSGEHDATRIAGFDTGNSPAKLASMDLSNRELVCLTSNGTRALNTLSDRNVIVASLTNARAAATYLSRRDTVHLVACGSSNTPSSEDLAGVTLLEQYLHDQPPSDRQKEELREQVRNASHAHSLIDHGFEEDVHLATEINRHEIVPELTDGRLHAVHPSS